MFVCKLRTPSCTNYENCHVYLAHKRQTGTVVSRQTYDWAPRLTAHISRGVHVFMEWSHFITLSMPPWPKFSPLSNTKIKLSLNITKLPLTHQYWYKQMDRHVNTIVGLVICNPPTAQKHTNTPYSKMYGWPPWSEDNFSPSIFNLLQNKPVKLSVS